MNGPRDASFRHPRSLWLAGGLVLVVAALTGWALHGSSRIASKTISPIVMGTTTRITAVGDSRRLQPALAAAHAALDAVNERMSTYLPESEVSRFNRAAADTPVPLHADTLRVLRLAESFSKQTDGAFDITVRPLARLWQDAAKTGQRPTNEQLERVRQRVGSRKLQIQANSATKTVDGLEVTLDAIAKGDAIHQAVVALQQFGLQGGLVDVGGDIECFGKPADGDAWRIALQHPAADSHLLVLRLDPRGRTIAVCTSGDYRRFVTIDGQRFSHIIDPRTGQPAQSTTSVTVVGPTATVADAWATALSVLGPQEGMSYLSDQRGLEALFLTGSADTLQQQQTAGFQQFLSHPAAKDH